jgi:hypothetical protein
VKRVHISVTFLLITFSYVISFLKNYFFFIILALTANADKTAQKTKTYFINVSKHLIWQPSTVWQNQVVKIIVLKYTCLYFEIKKILLPMRGTASLVVGMMADTMFMNTVNDNRIVTSAIRKNTHC